ncbi:MAG: hypothetical protein AB2421_02730 [Thermotaleaceae bacterium]
MGLEIAIMMGIGYLIGLGILAIIRVIEYFVTKVINWFKEKKKQRQCRQILLKASKILTDELKTQLESQDNIETISFDEFFTGEEIIAAVTDMEGNIMEMDEDIQIFDVKDLDTSKDIRDEKLINKLKHNSKIIEITV